MREAFTYRCNARFHNIGRGIEIGLADFEVDNIMTLWFKKSRFVQDFKGGFTTEAAHAAGQAEFDGGRFDWIRRCFFGMPVVGTLLVYGLVLALLAQELWDCVWHSAPLIL